MLIELGLIAAPRVLNRVARTINPFATRPSPPLGTHSEPVSGGNRWDAPDGEYETVYCATTSTAAFAETIAWYRPRPSVERVIDDFLEEVPDDDYDFPIEPGVLPDGYFSGRYLGVAHADLAYRYVDADSTTTHTLLNQHLTVFSGLGIEDVDRGVMLSQDRRITRPAARVLWQVTGRGQEKVAGIRYESRLRAEWECWAIWTRGAIDEAEAVVNPVTRTNEALLEAASLLGIQIGGT